MSEAELLRYAGAAESGSEHPIAKAIAGHAASELAVTSLTNTPGQGVTAVIAGREVRVGRLDWVGAESNCTELGPEAPKSGLSAEIVGKSVQASPATEVGVAWDGVFRGTITVGDTVKPTSAEAVRRFRALGRTPIRRVRSGGRRPSQ